MTKPKPGLYWIRFPYDPLEASSVEPAKLGVDWRGHLEWYVIGSDVPYDFEDLQIVGPVGPAPTEEE